jgi:zinc protease
MMRTTEVDGVPTLLAPTPGPMSAGLAFRVGRADESFVTGGITHLVEHLVLHRHGLTDYHFNGATGPIVTFFHMQGSESDVVDFLVGVCDSLADLPMERLETEKSILRTESAGRRRSGNEDLPIWRYGARDFGLLSTYEWGIWTLSAEQVREWAGRWFTRQNAVLWIAGNAVPAGLQVRLPEGVRQPVPRASSALPQAPAYFAGEEGMVVWDATVPRNAAGPLYSGVLERELYRALRQDGGYSYTAGTDYDPLGDEVATITALADSLPDKQDAVLGGFVDVLAKLRAGRIDPVDLAAVKAKLEEAFTHPEAPAMRLPSAAFNVLTGHPNLPMDEMRALTAAVTTDDVHAVALAAAGTELLQVPSGHSADWAGYAAAPTRSPHLVTGRVSKSRSGNGVELVVGPEGVSLVQAQEGVTVLFADCVAKMEWPDGARRIVGADGMTIQIEPTLYHLDPQSIATIDAAVDPRLVVRLPARSPDAVPQPPVKTKPTVLQRLSGLEETARVLLSLASGTVGILAVMFTAILATDADRNINVYFFVGLIWLLALILFIPTFFLVRRRVRYLRANR